MNSPKKKNNLLLHQPDSGMVKIEHQSRKWINITNIFFLSIFLIINLVIYFFINNNQNILFVNCLFFLVLLIIAIYTAIANSNLGLGILYGLASLSISYYGDAGNVTGILFIIFSICAFPNSIFVYFLLILNVLATFVKFIINDFNIFLLFNVFLFYIGAYSIFYFLIYKGGKHGREDRD